MAEIIRGTTPTVTFNLPLEVEQITNCEVYFSQAGRLLLVKHMDDCEMFDDEDVLAVTLTQAETLLFDPDIKLEMQIRFVFEDGAVEATNIVRTRVGRILKGGEIDVN